MKRHFNIGNGGVHARLCFPLPAPCGRNFAYSGVAVCHEFHLPLMQIVECFTRLVPLPLCRFRAGKGGVALLFKHFNQLEVSFKFGAGFLKFISRLPHSIFDLHPLHNPHIGGAIRQRHSQNA
jgi:hypothetical protein